MYCVIKCIVRGNEAHIKNADLRHPSCTVVMYRHKSASPVHNVLKRQTKTTDGRHCIRRIFAFFNDACGDECFNVRMN